VGDPQLGVEDLAHHPLAGVTGLGLEVVRAADLADVVHVGLDRAAPAIDVLHPAVVRQLGELAEVQRRLHPEAGGRGQFDPAAERLDRLADGALRRLAALEHHDRVALRGSLGDRADGRRRGGRPQHRLEAVLGMEGADPARRASRAG
jgi:hypothetical protein